MLRYAALLARVFAFLCVFFWLGSASAWIETQVRGHSARIEVDEQGLAIVRHELLLKVRGGPMKFLEISGIGTDIQPLPDAYVRSSEEGAGGRWPIHIASMEDGAVRLGISSERGLRGGNYLFSFAYQMPLLSPKTLENHGDQVIVSWVGPRLSSGVDSARVTFIVPHAEQAPAMASAEDGPGASVLLGEIRRGNETDEIDLIRAHLATGEPAVWKISTSRKAFSAALFGSKIAPRSTDGMSERATASRFSSFSLTTERGLVALGLGLGFFALLLAKTRTVLRLGQLCDARVVPLIPLPSFPRALLGGGFVVGLVWAVFLQRLTLALGFLVVALLVSTFLLPVRRVRPRGPGQWQLMSSDQTTHNVTLPGRWFDLRQWRGFVLLIALLLASLTVSYRILPTSNYFALMTLLGIPLLFPLFFVGNRKDFPQLPLDQSAPWHKFLNAALDPTLGRVELWGRCPILLDREPDQPAETTPSKVDEVRVRFVLSRAPHGLRSLELLLEEAAGAHVRPAVLVRVLEDSTALRRLPPDIAWQRGRSSDERVVIIRPTAPTYSQTTRLVRSLIKALSAAQPVESSKVSKSSGKSQVSSPNPAMGVLI